mgnify:FL=1
MTKAFLGLPAPAKLNLFLHVTGRRPDGKHLLQSAFVLINLCDTIDITLRDDDRIVRTGDVVGDIEKDLCVRAARALQSATGMRLGAEIHLEKRIPSQAGMGGGSSDAATVLLALNRLWNLGLSRTELMRLGLTLGADVPFFLFGQNAWAEGIGDELRPISLPSSQFLVVWPGRGLSTAEIFSHPSLTRNTKSEKMEVFSDFVRHHGSPLFGHNDLQIVAERLEPRVSDALTRIRQGGFEARMTGSGSAVFAEVSDADRAARKVLSDLPDDWRGFLCRMLAEHPLAAWCTE